MRTSKETTAHSKREKKRKKNNVSDVQSDFIMCCDSLVLYSCISWWYIVMKITGGIARVGRINRMENEFIFVFYTENRAKCDLNGRFV